MVIYITIGTTVHVYEAKTKNKQNFKGILIIY